MFQEKVKKKRGEREKAGFIEMQWQKMLLSILYLYSNARLDLILS